MLSRRGFLGAVAVLSGVVAGSAGARLLTGTVTRPAASGTSTTRCALCGSPDHAMLDPACPGAGEVR